MQNHIPTLTSLWCLGSQASLLLGDGATLWYLTCGTK